MSKRTTALATTLTSIAAVAALAPAVALAPDTAHATTNPARAAVGGTVAATSARHLPATPVAVRNLPAASQLHLPYGHSQIEVDGTYEGVGNEPLAGCQTLNWAAFGPNAGFVRTFAGRPAGGNDNGWLESSVQIASFTSHAAAVRAAKAMAGDMRCDFAMVDVPGTAHVARRTITLKGGQTAYLLVGGYEQPGLHQAEMGESDGVVATGTHVELVTESYCSDIDTETSTSIIATINATLRSLAR